MQIQKVCSSSSVSSAEHDILLSGPSDAGLADPGHETALSLTQVATTLMTLSTTLDTIVTLKIMSRLTDEIGTAFLRAHRRLKVDSRKTRQQRAL